MCCFLDSSPVKKPSLVKAHQFEGDPFDSGSEGSEGLGPCVSPLSTLIGTTAETSEEKYRLLDQRDRIMRQGMVYSVRATRWGVFTFHGTPRLLSLWVSDVPHLIVLVCQSS